MNISLIGMMGSGKSTIGKLLADKIKGYMFIDTDEEIVKTEKKTINEIFDQIGERGFREIESKILKKILTNDNQIIATGGGLITKKENLELLKKRSYIIYLSANNNILYERLKNNQDRPLLNTTDIKQKIDKLLNQRIPLYNQANKEISTNKKDPELIVNEIINELKRNERSNYKN